MFSALSRAISTASSPFSAVLDWFPDQLADMLSFLCLLFFVLHADEGAADPPRGECSTGIGGLNHETTR